MRAPRDSQSAPMVPPGYSTFMSRLRVSLLAFSALFFLTSEGAYPQYAYVTHLGTVVEPGAPTAVLPANPLRAFVYCLIASPGKGEPLAPSFVTLGNTTTRVRVQYPDQPPQPWGSTGEIWATSDQIALLSCTELVQMRSVPGPRNTRRQQSFDKPSGPSGAD